MAKKTRTELEESRKKYLALKQLTNCSGWPVVQQILTDEFKAALDTLSDPKTVKAEVEARGIIKFIKKFTDTLNSEMGFAELAQEEYIATYVNPPKDQKSE